MARMQTGVRNMADIIEGLLRLSRISRQQLRLDQVDLSKLAEDILVERFRHEPTRRVEINIEPDLVLCADPDLMTSAFTHLIENAWKFTVNTPQARIDVGQTLEDGRRVIFVRDNGAGFDMRYAKKLFQPFQRLHGSEFAGTGVGLAIVARAVERHDGRIWARSQPNEGATFYLSLPEIDLPAPLPASSSSGRAIASSVS
jgi:light-regulated signal transduction histidine kinase (bacteriophytochrome)